MSSDKTVVITAYGHGPAPERISVTLFDFGARSYCEAINTLALQDGAWIYARIVPEDVPVMLRELGIPPFAPLVLALDDSAIQKVMRKVDTSDLSKALKGADAEVQERFFRNMSPRAAAMLKEDMEFMGKIRKISSMEAQQKIVDLIYTLEATNEIVINRTEITTLASAPPA